MFLKCLKPLSNGCNIVSCYILRPFAHPVVCCYVLLGVVVQSLTPLKLLNQQFPKFLLLCDRRSVAQQCWIRNIMHMAALPTLLRPRTRIKHGLLGVYKVFMVCILSTPMHCRSQQCWELLCPFAHYCRHERNSSQHCWPNNVGIVAFFCT